MKTKTKNGRTCWDFKFVQVVCPETSLQCSSVLLSEMLWPGNLSDLAKKANL